MKAILLDAANDLLGYITQQVYCLSLACVYSYAVVRKIDKLEGTSSPSQFTSLR